MQLFLGVDGGQSDTTALIGAEDGRVLGMGRGGPCNHATAGAGRQKLVRAVSDSLAGACLQAGLEPSAVRFEAACFGMSGGPEDKQAILRELLPARQMLVTDDAVIALAGATAGEPGIVTIAGTGSIAFGRHASGRSARVGGWGYIFGDEGGGFDIVRQALRAALRAEEGWGPRTAIAPLLLEAVGAARAIDVMHSFYTPDWPRSRVAALAPLVDRAAGEGDRVAGEILRNAAQQLAMLSQSVRTQLWSPGEPALIVWIGGVFTSRILLERYRYLVELEEGNRCGPPQYHPAVGALIEAWHSVGLQPRVSNVPEIT